LSTVSNYERQLLNGCKSGLNNAVDYDCEFVSRTKDETLALKTYLEVNSKDVVSVIVFILKTAEDLAPYYPHVLFTCIDTYVPNDAPINMQGVLFAEEELGYMAGAVAGTVSKSKVVGIIAGQPFGALQRFAYGFLKGAKYVCPQCQVLGRWVNDPTWGSEDIGKAQAEEYINQNCDVIFGAAGGMGSHAIKYAASKKVMVIGVDQDEYVSTFNNGTEPGSEYILTSVLKKVPMAVSLVVKSVVENSFKSGNRFFDPIQNMSSNYPHSNPNNKSVGNINQQQQNAPNFYSQQNISQSQPQLQHRVNLTSANPQNFNPNQNMFNGMAFNPNHSNPPIQQPQQNKPLPNPYNNQANNHYMTQSNNNYNSNQSNQRHLSLSNLLNSNNVNSFSTSNSINNQLNVNKFMGQQAPLPVHGIVNQTLVLNKAQQKTRRPKRRRKKMNSDSESEDVTSESELEAIAAEVGTDYSTRKTSTPGTPAVSNPSTPGGTHSEAKVGVSRSGRRVKKPEAYVATMETNLALKKKDDDGEGEGTPRTRQKGRGRPKRSSGGQLKNKGRGIYHSPGGRVYDYELGIPILAPRVLPGASQFADHTTFCSVCTFGDSGLSNRIVLCDGCDAPFHQKCHNPKVSDETAENITLHWYCHRCEGTEKDLNKRKPIIDASHGQIDPNSLPSLNNLNSANVQEPNSKLMLNSNLEDKEISKQLSKPSTTEAAKSENIPTTDDSEELERCLVCTSAIFPNWKKVVQENGINIEEKDFAVPEELRKKGPFQPDEIAKLIIAKLCAKCEAIQGNTVDAAILPVILLQASIRNKELSDFLKEKSNMVNKKFIDQELFAFSAKPRHEINQVHVILPPKPKIGLGLGSLGPKCNLATGTSASNSDKGATLYHPGSPGNDLKRKRGRPNRFDGTLNYSPLVQSVSLNSETDSPINISEPVTQSAPLEENVVATKIEPPNTTVNQQNGVSSLPSPTPQFQYTPQSVVTPLQSPRHTPLQLQNMTPQLQQVAPNPASLVSGQITSSDNKPSYTEKEAIKLIPFTTQKDNTILPPSIDTAANFQNPLNSPLGTNIERGPNSAPSVLGLGDIQPPSLNFMTSPALLSPPTLNQQVSQPLQQNPEILASVYGNSPYINNAPTTSPTISNYEDMLEKAILEILVGEKSLSDSSGVKPVQILQWIENNVKGLGNNFKSNLSIAFKNGVEKKRFLRDNSGGYKVNTEFSKIVDSSN
ncbi:hypothetical protein HK099_000377, partial [Clydaea vesicula]